VAIHLAVEQQSLTAFSDPHYWPFRPAVADAREQRFESDEQALVAPYARSKPRACRMAKWRARYIVHDPSAGRRFASLTPLSGNLFSQGCAYLGRAGSLLLVVHRQIERSRLGGTQDPSLPR